ncbi:TetR/AcrR family transcriptional regulator C-terminal domain-containing protein [Dactylosporangium matsuzakiense]|uniref:Transcriptional regulator, TetR family n=1 Tax=Dactylosporangium matsuzakiense TaxID=53360 RepID=A0A9W6KFC8_9ACTN|nr:TetR/AcrR family transcriptional regulator C-terminal domain-containing protein [Dactylosporangium matsuzakiense]GLL01051.1 putative transcriptional regulator, TetR family [Dactylosporangium matsuzakiense]
MAINPAVVARTGLDLLAEVGLDGLTMRVVADRLGVRAPTLYWHVKNKQHLLDAMAAVMFAEATEGLAAPERSADWPGWVTARAVQLRRTLLRYRDGARVFAGTNLTGPDMPRAMELTLRLLVDAGFALPTAARGFAAVLHYTVGYAIEEQARQGAAYEQNPYEPERLAAAFQPERYPLAARAATEVFFGPDPDADFTGGLAIIVAGLGLMIQRHGADTDGDRGGWSV